MEKIETLAELRLTCLNMAIGVYSGDPYCEEKVITLAKHFEDYVLSAPSIITKDKDNLKEKTRFDVSPERGQKIKQFFDEIYRENHVGLTIKKLKEWILDLNEDTPILVRNGNELYPPQFKIETQPKEYPHPIITIS